MRWRFGEYTLDDAVFQLQRGDQSIPLEPKVFDVLRHLIQHRDRVVEKSELLDALWPGESVSESVLPRCVAVARRALGDDRSRQAILRTVHGRGYRFVAELHGEPSEGQDAAAKGGERSPSAEPTRHFHGRRAALTQLEDALRRAQAGDGAICLLVGEPGIGKTRTASELGERARAAGMHWLPGRCYEGEGAPAFWPFVQVLRALVAAEPDLAWLDEIGDGARDLAEWVPELRGRLSAAADGRAPTGEQARFRLFDSVARILRSASRRRPVAVLVDDLHWADPDAMQLFQFLGGALRESRVLLLGTYRDVEVRRDRPLLRALSSLAREPHCERIPLRGLAATEIASLCAELAGRPLPTGLSETLGSLTEGNPFFLREMVRLLLEQGDSLEFKEAAGPLLLPQSVRDAVGRRLDTLSEECNLVLRSAAVLGREFQLPVLERTVEVRNEILLELLGEALAAGILVEQRGGASPFAFDHALTRQTLYDELSVPARVQLHRRAADALEEVHGTTDTALPEIAHHLFEAVPGGSAERALAAGDRAAERAREGHAYEEAARLHERCLESLAFLDPPSERRRCETLLELGEALLFAGQRDGSRRRFEQAVEAARTLGRPDLLARAAIGFRGLVEMGVVPDEQTHALLEEAERELDSGFPAIRARLLVQLTGCPTIARTMVDRERLSQEAFHLAEQCGDEGALGSALTARYWSTLGPDRVSERLEVSKQALRIARRIGNPALALLAHEMEIGAQLMRGERGAVERTVAAYVEAAEALRIPALQFLARMTQASRALTEGRFEEADALADQAAAIGRGTVPYADVAIAGQKVWMRHQRGEPMTGLEASGLDPTTLSGAFGGVALSIRAASVLGLLERGERQAARTAWDALAADGFRDFERDEGWLLSMSILTDVALELQDLERATVLREQLEPYAELMVSHDLIRVVSGSVASLLGHLALLQGEAEPAIRWLEMALVKETDFRSASSLPRTRLSLARALRRRDQPADASRATELEARARADAAQLGIRLLEP
jgi:DNA-binding winged helix-turn-helix (wHTH) protein/tetratricopeptide (TPR) repeat protein